MGLPGEGLTLCGVYLVAASALALLVKLKMLRTTQGFTFRAMPRGFIHRAQFLQSLGAVTLAMWRQAAALLARGLYSNVNAHEIIRGLSLLSEVGNTCEPFANRCSHN